MTLREKVESFCRDGLPIIPKNELQMLRYEFNDEEILQTIANIIHENKPPSVSYTHLTLPTTPYV